MALTGCPERYGVATVLASDRLAVAISVSAKASCVRCTVRSAGSFVQVNLIPRKWETSPIKSTSVREDNCFSNASSRSRHGLK